MVNLEMYKAIIIYQILHFLAHFGKHNNVGRYKDWTKVVQVFIPISLNYVTCEIFIPLLHN